QVTIYPEPKNIGLLVLGKYEMLSFVDKVSIIPIYTDIDAFIDTLTITKQLSGDYGKESSTKISFRGYLKDDPKEYFISIAHRTVRFDPDIPVGNAFFFLTVATEKSEIKTHQDFFEKGLSQQIWDHFQLLKIDPDTPLFEKKAEKERAYQKKNTPFKEPEIVVVHGYEEDDEPRGSLGQSFGYSLPKGLRKKEELDLPDFFITPDNEYMRLITAPSSYDDDDLEYNLEVFEDRIKLDEYRKENYQAHFKGRKDFQGRDAWQLQYSYTKEGKKWRGIEAYILPQGLSRYGITFTIEASEDSKVKSFEDLGKKGVTGQVWQTFRFLGEEK
ncbi:MAG: hypothetical protein AAF734_07980, partial [Bacteroidota bacterium]